jgi:AMP phosphorylase
MLTFQLRTEFIDVQTGDELAVYLHRKDANDHGIQDKDRLILSWRGGSPTVVSVNLTSSLIKPGQTGLCLDFKKRTIIKNAELVKLQLLGIPESVKHIAKRLQDEQLTYQESLEVMADIVNYRLDDAVIAFYLSKIFFSEISDKELYHLTKAMVETGEQFDFGDKMIVDKHSTGGLAGNRITPIIVAIISALGLTIPKTSSRAVTSPAGTADTFEVLAPVSFSPKDVKRLLDENNAFLIWGADGIAPADDRIIEIANELPVEPFAKLVTSIMAKKVAMGIKCLIVDIPINPTAKVKSLEEAEEIEKLFLGLGKLFGMKIKVVFYSSFGPIGRGIGPALEARDVLRVLQQKDNRPSDLQKKSVYYCAELLKLAGKAKGSEANKMALNCLTSGAAWKQMQKIIKSQGGNPNIDSEEVKMGKIIHEVKAETSGTIQMIHNKALGWVNRSLGNPTIHQAGTYLNRSVGESVKKGDTLFTIYATSDSRLKFALEALKKNKIYHISKINGEKPL